MKNKVKIALMGYVILSALLILIFNIALRHKSKELITCSEHNIRQNEQMILLKNYLAHQRYLDNTRLNEEENLVSENDELMSLTDISNINSRLFLYFSAFDCMLCIENIFKIMGENCTIPIDSLVIIGNFENQRDIKIFKNTYHLNGLVLSINGGNFHNPFDGIAMPVLFLVDEGLRINCVQLVDKTQPEIIQNYFQVLEKKVSKTKV